MTNRYFDYQATTPLDERVLNDMMPYLTSKFGNPHSRTHVFGWDAEEAVEKARAQVASVIGASPGEIIFTSGATESNNIALKGVARFYKSADKDHIITAKTEHKCILDSCRHLEDEGFKVTTLSVQSDGLIDLNSLESAITDKTILVSIMAINNEIGVIQPVEEIGKICRSKGVFFHTDAAQAYGKIPLDVNKMHIDLMSISGHKIYGPKGIGALYVGKKPRVRIKPLFSGGGQERGIRSGTISPALAVGLGSAAIYSLEGMDAEYSRLEKLSRKFVEAVLSIPEVYLNGPKPGVRYPGNLNISIRAVEGESLIAALKDIAVGSGSACTSASLEPSYVLHALGVDEELAHTSIRFGIGRFTTEDDIDFAIQSLIGSINKLRNLSPLWEMLLAGVDLRSIQWTAH